MKEDDPMVADVRKARHQISAECGHDSKRLVAYYMEMEKKARQSGEYVFLDEEDRFSRDARLRSGL